MEASKCFGPRTLPIIHNVPLCLKTNFSLFPCRLLQSQSLSSKKSTKHYLFRVKAETSGDLESTRPLTYFSPSYWGDHFLSVSIDDSEFEALEKEIETVFKPKVRDMLMSPHSSDKERIRLIHLLISLGIAYYYENEIEEILHKAYGKLACLISDEDDLETIAIMFEVFRLYGHKMPCDVFERFKSEDGKFKESLVGDVRGLLQLYEAAHLGAPSEDIMDEALSFARYHLEPLAGTETSSNLFKHVENVLYRARYHSIEILVARQYISFYDQEEDQDETLLRFSKLNFNFCQMHYVKELKIVTRWWKELGIASKLPYSIRERNVETYLGGLGVLFEPRYSLARIFLAKLTLIMTVVDDTCDAYATLPEVQSLHDAFHRWDLRAMEELPRYMRIIYQSVFETVEDIDREMIARGKHGRLQLTIDEIKSLMIWYLGIAKWARSDQVPSFEDYMEIGTPSSALDDFASYGFIAMDDCDQKQLKEWFYSKPKIFHALNALFRIRNDIVTFEQEMSRGEVANGVNCYMKQHGVTKEAAVEELRKMERESYKIMIEEFMTSKAMPRQILVRPVNIARVMDLFYKEADGFGHPDQKLLQLIASLFLHPIPL
ncbi:Terpenoid cyclases/Protein prenyltransferases superfamily protein [Arabidopsis thaliana]|uniref:Terpenoid synthase 25 n=3 Tax=Arabidopsis thaliana TaxID=3702 RepID=TPS25_ARATH|nr:Terpenoid cyclases/Protein prenyltransferases superfamily protein [Arabidopsis thaliana]Q9LIA1.2 RecName: Full=Terpenoid synthase 25; Short=AtTPS25 [Arabidopsis thaliana]AEE77582.1 Terpenoid cyclases/Protein prenyltransferases superfamily protein [Arabidopsis thaliana]|eukprot:NP_189587.1 Terpenoid cyclases/Protein prenyltransferases superfamily protein [Arabidopsis thaliana]